MATIQKIDNPKDNRLQSVYSPIKLTFRVNGGDVDGLTGNVEDFVSGRFHFTPYNETTDQWLNNNNDSSYTNTALPNETFAVHVPYTPFIHGWSIDSTPNKQNTPASTGALYRYFTLDCAPLMRNYLSYNLRPCSHDTSNPRIHRDITLSQIAYNLFFRYQIGFIPEYIDTTGKLVLADGNGGRPDLKAYCYPRALNAAFTHNEEIYGYFAEAHNNETDDFVAERQDSHIEKIYVHDSNDVEKHYNRMKYLSVKPQNRIIGLDESEYLTFAAKDGASGIYATITFYDFNGNTIPNSHTDSFYGIDINRTADGDGTLTGHQGLFSYGDGGNANAPYAVIQIGVGTRNIKETAITHSGKFKNSQPLSDFSNVAYYEVVTRNNSSPYQRIGETIRYTIDHKRRNYNETTRFHWQCRLGGIDSYTFDGTTTRGLQTSSSTYQQTIYPKFRGQLSGTHTDNTFFIGNHIQQTTAGADGGALIQRIAGLTDDQYPSIRKHTVDAYGNGSATTRPITFDESQMIEDMMSSPNVWVERGWRAKEIFKEDFSSYSSVSEIGNNWVNGSDSGDFTTDASFVTDKGHITGNSSYQKGNNSGNDQAWLSSKKLFKYDPNKLYEVEIRLRDENGAGNYYCGLTGYAGSSNGDFNGTKVNANDGGDSYSSQHYITLQAQDLSNSAKWVVARGYISGYIRDSGVYGSDRSVPINHARAYSNYDDKVVEYFAPMFLLHHPNNAGIGYVDYIKVTEYSTDEPHQSNQFASSNKAYYVPVLLKDGNINTYDSENPTSVTVNYVESRKKRTIIT